eukprot:3270917-Pleurochrysis_carterae.AAC.1
METILSTIASPATRPAYRIQCRNSGREFIRLLTIAFRGPRAFTRRALNAGLRQQIRNRPGV